MMDTQTSDISQWSAQQMRNMTGSTPQLPLQGHSAKFAHKDATVARVMNRGTIYFLMVL
jgi:hypothetical protein